MRAAIPAMSVHPVISIIMPTYNSDERWLNRAIQSVRDQIYPHWELCIADDASSKPGVVRALEAARGADHRIKVALREANGHISAASNTALSLATGEWMATLDHDDELTPDALYWVAHTLNEVPAAQVIYSDEDKIDERGQRKDPFFKPDFSPALLNGQNYFNHLTVHRMEHVKAVGGWREGFEGSQDYDLTLRVLEQVEDRSQVVHIPRILYHWRIMPGSTALSIGEKDYAFEAGLRALGEHLERTGTQGRAETAPGLPYYRVRLDIPQPVPLVSLLIPTRDKADLLRTCIRSIIDKTTYPSFEIIVLDNNSEELETFQLFGEITQDPRIRVVADPSPFNYSALNNRGERAARGQIIGLVNNDIEVISPDWLTEMVSWALQPDVGCVGAKLYYANDTVQHAGVILGVGGVAGHSHKHFPRSHSGYFSRLMLPHELSAVTAACLLVRRDVYQAVGGLDEKNLTVAFNDVDFCLRIQEAGYRNIFTPYAELYHHESVSRGHEDTPSKQARFKAEIGYMETRWGDKLKRDPYYSPHLTLKSEDFGLNWSGPDA